MNLKSFLCVAATAIVAAACTKSSTDESVVSGDRKAFSVKVIPPSSKAVSDPTLGLSGATKEIPINSIRIKLTGNFAQGAIHDKEFTGSTALADANAYVFYDIIQVTRIDVYVNYDGTAASTSTLETAKGLGVSCFGYSTTFVNSNTVTTQPTPDGKTYNLWTTDVTVNPSVARLEASGVKITNFTSEDFAFNKTNLKLAAIYLDYAYEAGNVESAVATASPLSVIWSGYTGTLADYWTAVKNTVKMADFFATPLSIATDGTVANPVNGSTQQCYAYNFFVKSGAVATDNPVLTLAFSGVQSALEGVPAMPEMKFVSVKAYKADGQPIVFRAGNIYRITALEFRDQEFTGPQGENSLIAVKATVTVTPWNIKDVTVEWK